MKHFDSEDPEVRELAERLLRRETSDGETTGTDLHAAFRVCQRLRRHVVTFTGTEGFRSLLARAVSLARAQAPLLSAVRVNLDGTFDLLDEAAPLFEGKEAAAAASQLVAELLGLLTMFVGPALTLRLVHGAWPEAYADFVKGEDL